MPKNNHARNVSGLRSHATAKSDAVAQQVEAAIRSLVSQNAAVNFNAVATLAGVSKTTLYNNPQYRSQIEKLRRDYFPPSAPTKCKITDKGKDKGKDVILAAKNKRIRELEAEVERLSNILKHYYASEYDKC